MSGRRRDLIALPMLAITGLVLRVMFTLTVGVGPEIDKFDRESVFTTQTGLQVPLIRHFYRIPGVDYILLQTTIAFGYALFEDLQALWWQTLAFLVDDGLIYVIVLLESFRRSNKGTIFQASFVIGLAGQLLGVGTIMPIYQYFLYLRNPVEKLAAGDARLIDRAAALCILPVMAAVFYVPGMLSFLVPSFDDRLWWNWLWQPFPVWASLALFPLTRALPSAGLISAQRGHMDVVRVIIPVLCAVSAGMHWYVRLYSGFSFREVFLPAYFFQIPESNSVAFHNFLQWDYVGIWAAQFLWLDNSLADLKHAGLLKASWARIALTALVIGVAGSPGSVLAIGWLVREEILQSMDHQKTM